MDDIVTAWINAAESERSAVRTAMPHLAAALDRAAFEARRFRDHRGIQIGDGNTQTNVWH